MKIYFIRHGESENNHKGIISGQSDSELTEVGIRQVKKVASELADDFTHIYSSDLIRCKQTAKIFAERANLQVIYDPRLRERDFGSLTGKTWPEVGLDLKKIDREQKYDYREYGGESVNDVKKRVFDFIDLIIKNGNEGKTLVVTSAGVIRLLSYLADGQILDNVSSDMVYVFDL